MTALPVHFAHFVRIKYLGPTNYRPSRLSVIWEGWPSEGSPIVRKSLAYTSDRDEMARQAAQLFCDWLSQGWGDGTEERRYIADRITLASMNGDEWALMVHTTLETVPT